MWMVKRRLYLAWGVFVAALALTPGVCRALDTEAITKPSEDVTLSFLRPGRIAKVSVKDGDTVQAGQLLIQLDDAAEKVQVSQLEAEAKDETRVRAAEAQLAQKKEDLGKLEWLLEQKAIPQWDVAHAKLDVTIAELSLQLARFELEQNKRKYEEAEIQLARMRLVSPFAGRVERIFLRPGESADTLQKVVRVVKIDPLWIEVPAPLEQARLLSLGAPASIGFNDNKPGTMGKVTHIAAVADAASNTLTVRVELPNPAGRPAGEHVKVSFPFVAAADRAKPP